MRTIFESFERSLKQLENALLSVTILALILTASMIAVGVGAWFDISHLNHRVSMLENACMPVDPHNDVALCTQPTRDDLALRVCLTNPNYIGGIVEDDRALLVKCMDAWEGH